MSWLSRDCLHSQLGRSQQEIGRQGTMHLRNNNENKKKSLIDIEFFKRVALKMPMNGLRVMGVQDATLDLLGPDSRHGSS